MQTMATLSAPFSLQNQDCIFINGLTVDAIIGVYEWEQAITQPLVFDVQIFSSQHLASHSDSIHDAINYKTVCERIAEISKTSQVALLERLAKLVSDMILKEFDADTVVVTIHKPTAIKNTSSVGVQISRSKVQYTN